MNREIKFRAWVKYPDNNPAMKEVYGFNKDFVFVNTHSDYRHSAQYFNNCILMQFTGVTDKNGKEIYEGDIDNKKRVCEYFPALGSFGFKSPKHSAITFLGQFINSKQEIIGNIYENPELLK